MTFNKQTIQNQVAGKASTWSWSQIAAQLLKSYGPAAVKYAKDWYNSTGQLRKYQAAKAPKNQISRQYKQPMQGQPGGTSFIAPVSYALVSQGDYFISLPSDSGVRVRGKEEVGTIATSIATTATAFTITPSDTTCFPRLSTLAALFRKYKINYLRFTAKSARPTSETGILCSGFSYDVNVAGPSTVITTMRLAGSQMTSAYLTHVCELNPSMLEHDWYYTGAVAGSDDARWNNAAKYLLNTEGQVGAVTGWYVCVEYDIELVETV